MIVLDTALFLWAGLLWFGGVPIWIPIVLFLLALLLLFVIVDGIEGIAEFFSDFFDNLL